VAQAVLRRLAAYVSLGLAISASAFRSNKGQRFAATERRKSIGNQRVEAEHALGQEGCTRLLCEGIEHQVGVVRKLKEVS
jgi:hypothetical protein